MTKQTQYDVGSPPPKQGAGAPELAFPTHGVWEVVTDWHDLEGNMIRHEVGYELRPLCGCPERAR
jgi:hypothetical protein